MHTWHNAHADKKNPSIADLHARNLYISADLLQRCINATFKTVKPCNALNTQDRFTSFYEWR